MEKLLGTVNLVMILEGNVYFLHTIASQYLNEKRRMVKNKTPAGSTETMSVGVVCLCANRLTDQKLSDVVYVVR